MLSISPTVLKGHLKKLGSSLLGSICWKEFFFVLEQGKLSYFEVEHWTQQGLQRHCLA